MTENKIKRIAQIFNCSETPAQEKKADADTAKIEKDTVKNRIALFDQKIKITTSVQLPKKPPTQQKHTENNETVAVSVKSILEKFEKKTNPSSVVAAGTPPKTANRNKFDELQRVNKSYVNPVAAVTPPLAIVDNSQSTCTDLFTGVSRSFSQDNLFGNNQPTDTDEHAIGNLSEQSNSDATFRDYDSDCCEPNISLDNDIGEEIRESLLNEKFKKLVSVPDISDDPGICVCGRSIPHVRRCFTRFAMRLNRDENATLRRLSRTETKWPAPISVPDIITRVTKSGIFKKVRCCKKPDIDLNNDYIRLCFQTKYDISSEPEKCSNLQLNFVKPKKRIPACSVVDLESVKPETKTCERISKLSKQIGVNKSYDFVDLFDENSTTMRTLSKYITFNKSEHVISASQEADDEKNNSDQSEDAHQITSTVKVIDEDLNDGKRDTIKSSGEETSDDSSDDEEYDDRRDDDAVVPDRYLFTDEEFLRQFSGKQREIVEQNLKEINEIKEFMAKLDSGEIPPVEEPSSFDPSFSAFSYIFNRDLNEAPQTTATSLASSCDERLKEYEIRKHHQDYLKKCTNNITHSTDSYSSDSFEHLENIIAGSRRNADADESPVLVEEAVCKENEVKQEEEEVEFGISDEALAGYRKEREEWLENFKNEDKLPTEKEILRLVKINNHLTQCFLNQPDNKSH